jgi:TP901 family phage tail tape measure protein
MGWDHMAEVGSLFVRLRADASEFEQTMQGVSGRLNDTGSTLQGIGGSMSKNVTAPLVGVATAAVLVGANFDDQMAKVQAISGATGDDFDTLRGRALELGSSTRFSATEAAEGLEYLALAGWDTAEMADGLEGVLMLASAAGMDLGRTADIVTDTMSAFGIEAAESSSVADMFATTSASANTNVEQLGGALAKAGPILAAMGMDLDEAQAALGMMADQGLKGSRAGTALGAIMRDLTANVEDGKVSFGDFSVEVFDAEGNMRDFGAILGDLETGLEGMSDEQRNAALSSIFQQQALQGINPLLSEGTERYDELRGAIIDSEGASQRMSETMEGTLGGSFRALRSQLEGVLIQLSDVLTPIIQDQVMPAIERLVGFISNLIDRFDDLDPTVQKIILGVAGFAAAVGPVLIILGTLIKLVGLAAAGVALLASPIVLVVAGLALLAGALYLAYTRSETFRNIVDTVASVVRDVVVKAFNLISDRIMEFVDNVLPELIETFEFVRDKIEAVVEFIYDNIIKPTFDAISGFIEDHGDTIMAVIEGVWEIIESTISTAIDIIEGIIIGFLALIRGDWETAWDAIKGVADSVKDHLETVFGNVRDFVVGAFETLRDKVSDTVTGWIDDLTGWVSGLYDDFTDTVADIRDSVVDFISDMVSDTWDAVTGWVDDIVGAVTELASDVISEMESLPGRILSALGDAATLLLDWGKDLIGGLIQGIRESIPGLDTAVSWVTDRLPGSPAKTGPLRPLTLDPEGVLGPFGESLMAGFAAGIDSAMPNIDRNLSHLTSGLQQEIGSGAGTMGGGMNSDNGVAITNVVEIDGERWFQYQSDRIYNGQQVRVSMIPGRAR